MAVSYLGQLHIMQANRSSQHSNTLPLNDRKVETAAAHVSVNSIQLTCRALYAQFVCQSTNIQCYTTRTFTFRWGICMLCMQLAIVNCHFSDYMALLFKSCTMNQFNCILHVTRVQFFNLQSTDVTENVTAYVDISTSRSYSAI